MDSPRRHVWRGGRGVLVPILLVAAALAGCGMGPAEADVRAAADAFLAEAGTDPAAACERLAPETRSAVDRESGAGCQETISGLGLADPGAAQSVSVAGHSAQVRYAGDAVFLALFDDGWRVTAAGCHRLSGDPAEPYDCDVEGG